jgi:hypothetical protein
VSLYKHVPHPHIEARKAAGPVKVADQHDQSSVAARLNARLAVAITKGVGSMWCAYAFAIFDMLALPTALKAGVYGIVQWTASFFLQLVLLSIIMVGQNISSAAADKRAEATYLDAEAVLHEATEIQKHLAVQDEAITHIRDHVAGMILGGGQPDGSPR